MCAISSSLVPPTLLFPVLFPIASGSVSSSIRDQNNPDRRAYGSVQSTCSVFGLSPSLVNEIFKRKRSLAGRG